MTKLTTTIHTHFHVKFVTTEIYSEIKYCRYINSKLETDCENTNISLMGSKNNRGRLLPSVWCAGDIVPSQTASAFSVYDNTACSLCNFSCHRIYFCYNIRNCLYLSKQCQSAVKFHLTYCCSVNMLKSHDQSVNQKLFRVARIA